MSDSAAGPRQTAKALEVLFSQAWAQLERGVADRRAPARHLTFATVSPKGQPEVRTVVLRAATRSKALLEVHTDSLSAKVSALAHTPCAALHAWIPRARLQIRITAAVTVLTGGDVSGRWQAVPAASRAAYGTRPPPGTPISDADAYEKTANLERFAVLHCQVQDMDLLHLGDPHRRALFTAGDGWQGCWLSP